MVFVLNIRFCNFFSLFTFFFPQEIVSSLCISTPGMDLARSCIFFLRERETCLHFSLFVFRCPGTKLIALLSGIVCPCFRVCLLFALCQGRRLNLLFTLFSHCAGQGALRCKVRCFDWHIVVWDCIK